MSVAEWCTSYLYSLNCQTNKKSSIETLDSNNLLSCCWPCRRLEDCSYRYLASRKYWAWYQLTTYIKINNWSIGVLVFISSWDVEYTAAKYTNTYKADLRRWLTTPGVWLSAIRRWYIVRISHNISTARLHL